MKILYAVLGYKPAVRIGGPAVSVPAVAERLVRRGHEVTVVSSDRDLGERLDVPLERGVDIEGVKVWYFPASSVFSGWLPGSGRTGGAAGFLYAPSMASALERLVGSVDVVHTHMPFIYPSYAAAHAAFAARKPLFYHQRGLFDPRRLQFRRLKKRIYLEVIEKPILRRATMLFALTEREVESYRRLGVVTPCRVIPNGVELPAVQPDPASRARARWGIPEDALVIAFLGRLHPLKGTRTLLQAFAGVHRTDPRARLVMAGPDENGEEEVLRAMTATAGLEDAVLFPGVVKADEKDLLLARADVFCLPSAAEGFSMAVLEALAAGKAVLLTPGCNFPEVEAAGAGRIVKQDPGALEEALSELLADRKKLEQMGSAGRKLVERDYSWERVVDRLLEAYTEGIGLHRHRVGMKPRT